MTTNNLPGLGLSTPLNTRKLWEKHHHYKKIIIKHLNNNHYSLNIPISKQELDSLSTKKHQYVKLLFNNRKYTFFIKNIHLSKNIINNENIITNSTVGSITNITNINNNVIPGPLITFGPDGICVGCETYGLVNYTIIFPGEIPILSSNDPFIIEGAEIFLI